MDSPNILIYSSLETKGASSLHHLSFRKTYDYNEALSFKGTLFVWLNYCDVDIALLLQNLRDRIFFVYDRSMEFGSYPEYEEELQLEKFSKKLIHIKNPCQDKVTKKCRVVDYDYFFYDATIQQQKLSKNVLSRPPKFNLLMSKIGRPVRFATAWKLAERNLLKEHIISFTANKKDVDAGFAELNYEQMFDKQYSRRIRGLLKSHCGSIDNVPSFHSNTSEGLMSIGWPVDVNIYDKSNVSYIAETLDGRYDVNFLSEKTTRTLLMKHPFVMQSNPGFLKHMKKEYGFETFNDLIDESYNEYIPTDTFNHIDNVINSAIALTFAVNNNKELVKEKVNHNFNILQKVAQENNRNLKYIFENLAV
jgi:hypothetical protein